ncbi:MAG: polysaccharide export protein [Edaphobacter sp.]|nr:polysaccharide export protein [Edaphobacter sp.]
MRVVQDCFIVWDRRAKQSVTASLVYFLLTAVGVAQQLQVPSLPTGLPSTLPSISSSANASATASTEDDKTTSRSSNDGGSLSANPNGTLTARQIIAIVQARPELIVDIKQVMADYLEQQGNPVQVDSITDDMLYRGIGSDAGLRGAISIWLRARGYVSEADFDRSDLDPKSSDDVASTINTTALGLPNSLASGAAGDSGRSDPNKTQNSTSTSDGTQGRRIVPKQAEGRDGSSAAKPDRNNPSAVQVVHQTAPYNLQSLRDLYTQVPEQTSNLKRFGSDMFVNRGTDTKQMSVDIPIGPDYIVGVGDGLIVNLWGGVSQSFSRTVDREGKIVLPEAGTIVVAGLSLERAQALVQIALSQQFRDAKVAVTIARLRTVRVYVVGDVQRPGAYDITSLSTPLNALYAAGGPTSIGSLRVARHYRGKELVREVDLYEFLLRGVRPDTERIQDGDTILVSPAGRQVAVAGMVKRPAIYELKDETKLSDVLNDAGGVLVSASLTHITIERVGAQGHRTTLNLDLPEGSTTESSRKLMDAFAIQDGDRVSVAPILPYSERTIYLEGHVVRPGKVPYRDDMKLNDVIRSYQDLLPEPADRGVIIRLMPPDLRAEAIDFNVPDVLTGNEQIHLQPFDTIRVLGRYEADGPKVQVHGEVLHPGTYPLSRGMTMAQLVRMAGGFNRSALLDDADLASYDIRDGKQVLSRRDTVKIGEAVNNPGSSADAVLKPGDVLTVHQISGWNDIGSSVSLEGEITYPGPYGIQEGERLSSVLKRAGGFRATAYPMGAVLVRNQVKELEDKSRSELIHQIETTPAGAKLGSSLSAQDDAATLQILVQQQKAVVERLRTQPSIGRLVIRISGDIASWEGTAADIEMRRGDVLTVPKKPGFVLISGQVYNASAITFVPGKTAGWYLKRAGGSTEGGNMKEVLVIRANGLVVGRRSGEWYEPGVLETKLEPGDVVVVPQKVFGGSAALRNLFASAQILSSVGFAAALALR